MAVTALNGSPVVAQLRVIRALVLRDMRSRVGSGFFGYVIVVLIPFGHLLGLMIVPLMASQLAPLGTDYALFIATGVLPYILCLYPSRMTMLCLAEGAPLLAFPIVKPLDVILARAFMEMVVAFTVTVFFLLVLVIADIDIVPHDFAEATGAILGTIFLGLSFGLISAIIFKLFRAWLFIQISLLILMYLTSGAFFMPRLLPEEVRAVIVYNPLFHSVEWLRVAYYQGYSDELLSRSYLFGSATILIFLAILLERSIRGRLAMV